ncbi:MAG: hypothetical protein WCJ09_10085 [Planctomycetota bacterium]
MARSLFSSASVWGSLAMLAMTGSASAQWFPFGGSNSCNCGARPTMMAPFSQSASYSSAYNPVYQTAYTSQAVSCGQPVACTIEQPVQTMAVAQTVRVQALQPVVHPVYDTVQVVEYQPVKQKVQRAVTDTKWVDQAVTEMRPVTEQRTVNVPTVDYQNVTEYKKVQKQVGYYATKTEPVNKVPACAYDNSPGFVGWMNRTGHDIRNSFTPNTKVSRTFVPQTMTCTVPCTKKVAIQGMKQVTYNVTSMVPHQTTRKVAVNSVRYVEEEVTAMKAVTVARTVQVGTRVSYAPVGGNGGVTASGPGNGGSTALQPTPDTNSNVKRTATGDDGNLNPEGFTPNSNPNKKISYPVRERESDRGEVTETVIPSRPAMKAPSVIRVSQWVARAPSPTVPALDQTASMSIAGTVR